MARSKSSQRWLREHFDDEFVKQAQRQGYRSRAVFKLEEIQQRDHLIRPGSVIVDLGAAPGGWSQYALEHVGRKGRILAMDLLPMEPLEGVEFVEGDFQDDAVLERLLQVLAGQEVDLVMSDIAPNISGVDAVDQPRAMYLVELAVDFAERTLRPGGDFLAKAFHGEGFDALVKDLRGRYDKVLVRKPKASRPRSREVYVLARGRKV
ncbi:MAG: 23S rRNA (uridine(2552)-2'-O)-methyltransferase RlmE [Thiogranum sp.]|nr:23S rRNA (uridine(2552)-2'-O)-methyltransferase RlmE [Thiogranum sp.]